MFTCQKIVSLIFLTSQQLILLKNPLSHIRPKKYTITIQFPETQQSLKKLKQTRMLN